MKIGASEEAMDKYLGIKYKLSTNDQNFDALLKALDVNIWYRLLARITSAHLVLTKCDDEYTMAVTIPFKNFIQKFRPGVMHTAKTPDGRIIESTITFNGNVLNEVEIDQNGKVTSIERTFNETHVVSVLKVGDIVATRIYKANI